MYKYWIFAIALLLGCLAIPVVEPVQAGNCHGTPKKTVAEPVAVVVEQDVTVTSPSVTVKETVEVDGPGNVTVVEEVTVGEPVGGGVPIGRRAARQASLKVASAMRAESRANRKAAKAEIKVLDETQKSAAESATARAFFN